MLHLLLALSLSGPPNAPPDDEEVARWRGRAVDAEELAEAFGDAVPECLAAWAPWSAAHGYVAHVEDQGRVIVFLADDARGVVKELERVTEVCDHVEALLRPAAAPGGAAEPELTPLAPAVLLHTRDEAEFATVLDHAATLEPSLGSWVEFGKSLTGFTLVKPLASGWAVEAAGRVEWNPDNELVHRLTALLVLRRFGEVPYWLLTGVSWHVEHELCKHVYCFPYRDEFVWATEHTAWPQELAKLFDEGRDVFLADVVAWRRGTFDADRGRIAWGFAKFAASTPGALAAAFHELSELRRTEGIRRFDDGRWELIVGWEASLEQQRDVFARLLGADFEARASAAFRARVEAPKKKKGSKEKRQQERGAR